ncbi:unnamed protein product [Protopolystoma xenopodis]|uniref:Uncharacterized protein n=1 Tax=Protopolystoma xenopodis TaxID=117903 RepID=A0A3S5AIF6_9PLAT|nr:unnamed protein product [Protopolystoma xenopodis]
MSIACTQDTCNGMQSRTITRQDQNIDDLGEDAAVCSHLYWLLESTTLLLFTSGRFETTTSSFEFRWQCEVIRLELESLERKKAGVLQELSILEERKRRCQHQQSSFEQMTHCVPFHGNATKSVRQAKEEGDKYAGERGIEDKIAVMEMNKRKMEEESGTKNDNDSTSWHENDKRAGSNLRKGAEVTKDGSERQFQIAIDEVNEREQETSLSPLEDKGGERHQTISIAWRELSVSVSVMRCD